MYCQVAARGTSLCSPAPLPATGKTITSSQVSWFVISLFENNKLEKTKQIWNRGNKKHKYQIEIFNIFLWSTFKYFIKKGTGLPFYLQTLYIFHIGTGTDQYHALLIVADTDPQGCELICRISINSSDLYSDPDPTLS